MSLILPTFLIYTLYEKRFSSTLHTFLEFMYTIYSHVHNVAFTFQVSKVFNGIHISCLQLQLSLLCNEMVFMRS